MESKQIKFTKSAGGVVVNNEGRILVVNQKGTSWSLPKGHIEDGEDEITTARREIYEESGIKILNFLKKLGTYQRFKIGLNGGDDRSESKEITMFLFKTEALKLSPIDLQNPEARWIDKDKVPEMLTHSKDKEFFLKIKNKI